MELVAGIQKWFPSTSWQRRSTSLSSSVCILASGSWIFQQKRDLYTCKYSALRKIRTSCRIQTNGKMETVSHRLWLAKKIKQKPHLPYRPHLHIIHMFTSTPSHHNNDNNDVRERAKPPRSTLLHNRKRRIASLKVLGSGATWSTSTSMRSTALVC